MYSASGADWFFDCLSLKQAKERRPDKIHLSFPPCNADGNDCDGMENVFLQAGIFEFISFKSGEWSGLWGEVHTDYLGTETAFWVLVFSYIWKNTGYTVVLWLAGILAIPEGQIEAAKVDGAGSMRRIIYIILPNLKGTLYTIVILSFLNSFKIYREAYLVAGAYPHKSIYLLQHTFNNWFVNLEFDKMAAAAVCTGAFLLVAILVLQKMWDREI